MKDDVVQIKNRIRAGQSLHVVSEAGPDQPVSWVSSETLGDVNEKEAWRSKYLERTQVHLRLIEYLGRHDATTDGALLILSGLDPSREA